MKRKRHEPRRNLENSSSNCDTRCGLAISRREFLIGGVSLATLAALPMPVLADSNSRPRVTVRRSQDGLLDTKA